ncbi:uncharacterized protein LOC132204137 [Neocloeon triangulifer]|uniref:uncharacterized protein LOC132204137 n=1 Tax=Neocloeon triangulifer TaxID=2078957 RepID=UPI00286F7AAB|nr:uncharacterized protein LOC132204137 [Neocloeon triangulifer]
MPWPRSSRRTVWGVLTLFTVLRFGVLSVKITQLKVPRLVQNGSDVTLDCEFQVEPHESRHLELVVKWFFGGDPEPVYQWIPAHGRPQGLGLLKGRLDLNYGTRNERGSAGIRIVGATTELTGDYKCSISTYDGEDFMIKPMIVFAPETNMYLQYGRPAEDTFNISCVAEGVFPEPRMFLYYARPDVKDKTAIKAASLCETQQREYPMEGVTVETGRRGDSFTTRASAEVEDLEHFLGAILFICELRVPQTEYCQRRAIMYLPGGDDESHQIDAEGGSGTAELKISALLVAVIPTVTILYHNF